MTIPARLVSALPDPRRLDPRRLGRHLLGLVLLAACVFSSPLAEASRLKEIASVQGVRSNQLIGYGLVVGLDGTGDQTTQAPFTVQSLTAMLSQLGVQIPPGVTPQLRNAAAVMLTAQLPPFAQPGQTIDITVSSMGNAKSLRGGTLLLTPLRGADGQVYGMAQGSVVVGGAGASAGGSSVQVNHLSAGRIPNGATVERAVPSGALTSETVRLELKQTDFTTARRVVDAVNAHFGSGRAVAVDGRTIQIQMPESPENRVAFVGELEQLEVELPLAMAKVIVNARTGSVVLNQNVTLEECAVAHGNLSVAITSTPLVSQPAPFSQGSTVVAEQADITIRQDGGNLMHLKRAARLTEVVTAMNSLGANAQDLIAILQAMRAATCLKAELEII